VNSAASAGVSPRQAGQYAYFVYRSLDCFSHLVTGATRSAREFDANTRLYARTINLLLRHGGSLPDFGDVLPTTEAACSLMFHVAMCDRAIFWPALAQACEAMFADVRRAAAVPGGLPPETKALVDAFERAIGEHGLSEPAGDEPRLPHVRLQLLELAERHRLLLEEAESLA
jgi:hypothetical protein